MKLSFFIARRIAGNKATGFSRFIIRLATIATALSVAIMIIAVAVVVGFKQNIKSKMFVFWGQIEVTPFNPNPSSIINPDPINYNDTLARQIKGMQGVQSVHIFATKPVILRAKSGILEGIKLKGIDASYPLSGSPAMDFKGKRINFTKTKYSKQIILSENTLNKLNIRIGDTVIAFFIDPNKTFPSIRQLTVAGTYHTGMENIDHAFALCDINLIRNVNGWNSTAINGYQIAVDDYTRADSIGRKIYESFLKPPLYTNSMEDIYPDIYSWLSLMDTNAYIILAVMAVVAVINLSTALLIFILERTNMTGILKSLGMPTKKIQHIFLYHAAIVALKGIVYGTIGGVGFCLLQQHFHLITLNESAYYMKYMPVELISWQVILIDVGTLLFCTLIMTIPALFVRRINITKALRFR